MQLDNLDLIAAKAFEGFVIRKELPKQFRNTYPIPTYVIESLLSKYCSSTNAEKNLEGLEIVKSQLQDKTVRPAEEEYFISKAKENVSTKIIDFITVRLDPRTDSYLASLPSLQLKNIRIPSEIVDANDRILTGGFYAEMELEYNAAVAQQDNEQPFEIVSVSPFLLSQQKVLEDYYKGREHFTLEEWKNFLIRSVGIEPTELTEKAKNVLFVRMIPFIERNYNMIELGPRATGKSYLYQQISPYSILISGGKIPVGKMFINMANGEHGLVCKYDVVCFDEVSGLTFDQIEGVHMLKAYMANGEFSRGKNPIRADGGIIMLGNADMESQQKTGHLFDPLPPLMRNDTAFMDRIHAFVPGWDFPKLNKTHFTDHYGLRSDFLAECWSKLRDINRISTFVSNINYSEALDARDKNAVNKTLNGLLKLMQPNPAVPISDEILQWSLKIALEYRRRVKEQQKIINPEVFSNTNFSYSIGDDGIETIVSTPEFRNDNILSEDPVVPRQI